MEISQKFAGIIMSFFVALGMSFVMSFVMIYANVGFVENFLMIWIRSWIIGMVVGFPAAAIFVPTARHIVKYLIPDFD